MTEMASLIDPPRGGGIRGLASLGRARGRMDRVAGRKPLAASMDSGHTRQEMGRGRRPGSCQPRRRARPRALRLRRSGVKHLIDSGNDPHTVMAFSGHRTPSMLRPYHIIDVDDLRRAAARASAHRAESAASVTPLVAGTRRERAE
jgi:integrase